jgi:hypothetical protein
VTGAVVLESQHVAVTSLQPRGVFAEEPHEVDPSGCVGSWYTNPPGALVSFIRPAKGSLEVTEWLIGPAREALERRFPAGPLVLIMDLGLMTGRDPAVRAKLIESGRQLKSRIVKTVVVPPVDASAIYIASVRTAMALAAVVGVHVEISRTLAPVISKLGLTVAAGDPKSAVTKSLIPR